MLPSNLLRSRISKGEIRPTMVPIDAENLKLAKGLVHTFEANLDVKKGVLLKKIKEIELDIGEYKLVRGLATLLERRCTFELEKPLKPGELRLKVFEQASIQKVLSSDERKALLTEVGSEVGLSHDDLDRALWSDIDEALILRKFEPISPDNLLKRYNLSLVQTLILRSLRLSFTTSGNWSKIFRLIKFLSLIYSVEREDERIWVSVDGPVSLFKMTDKYGSSLANLIPSIVRTDTWTIRAEVMQKSTRKTYGFNLDSETSKESLGVESADQSLEFDSSVEADFSRRFNAYDSGWELKREPEPLPAGSTVIIPDFSFEKAGIKVYLEIVGFWTPGYLERKLAKLSKLKDVDMIVAVDEKLACSRVQRVEGHVFYYSKTVPIKPILDHLKDREGVNLQGNIQTLTEKPLILQGDIVSLVDISNQYKVDINSVKIVTKDVKIKGYTLVGDHFISESKLQEVKVLIDGLVEPSFNDAVVQIETVGLENANAILEEIGYEIVWAGLDVNKSTIRRIDVTEKR